MPDWPSPGPSGHLILPYALSCRRGSVSHKSGGLPDTVPKHQRCKGSLRGSAEGLLKGDLGPLQTLKGTAVNPFKLTVTTKELFLSSHKVHWS